MNIPLTSYHFEQLLNPDLGATCVIVPDITERYLAPLNHAADRALCHTVPEKIGTVVQHFRKCQNFAEDSIYIHFAHELAQGLHDAFTTADHADLLHAKLTFDDLTLHQYGKTPDGQTYGIGPHRDFGSYINLVVVVLLRGPSNFYICKDRDTSNSQLMDAKPGNIILMRGGNFGDGTLSRPMHYVSRLGPEGRISFGLRQIKDEPGVREKLQKQFSHR